MQSAEAVAEGLSQDLVPYLKPFSVYSYLARHITEKARHQAAAGTPQRQHCSARPCDITALLPPLLQRLFLRRNLSYYAPNYSAKYLHAE